jgi:periplasmic protein CpxP/Spy
MRSKICTVALTSLLTLGLAGGAAFAQEDTTTPPAQTNNNTQDMHQQGMHHRGMNSDRQLKRMTKKLDLSADQQSQIKPILDSQDQQMEQLRADKTMSRQDRHQKMMDIRQDTSQKIEAVLNDTQKQKYESMHKGMKENGMHHESQPEQQPQ